MIQLWEYAIPRVAFIDFLSVRPVEENCDHVMPLVGQGNGYLL